MKTHDEILELLDKLQKNEKRRNELDEQLLQEKRKAAWMILMKQRAQEYSLMYEENNRLRGRLLELLQEELDEESAQKLFDKSRALHLDGYDDCEIQLPVFYKLMQYYEKNKNVPNLLFLYGAIYYLENDVKRRREGNYKFDETYNLKVIEHKPMYFELPYEGGRYRFWSTYYNLIVVGLGNGAFTPDESCQLFKEAMEFWNSPEVQELDGQNEELIGIIERITNEWLIVEENIEEAGRETKRLFCETAERVFESQLQQTGSILDVNSEVYAAYLHAQVLKGDRDFLSIIEEFFAFYMERLQEYKGKPDVDDDDFYFILNTPLIIGGWMKNGVSREKAMAIMNVLKETTLTTWYQDLGKRSSAFMNEVIAEWCFELMEYSDSEQEKEELLFQLLVRRQLPTYLHSIMVMKLAEAISKEALQHSPELFDEIDEEQRSNLLRFIRRCALFHDVGKTKITDIVNTQCRNLADWEFNSIRLHPEFGAQILNRDEALGKYRDVALGHHKFYNGEGGYPAHYDNTKSPYRIITDLITICDCMDAATDQLGRNYKRAKNFDMVLQELIEGKATRYNPDLVELIEKSPKLQEELRYIVGEGRPEIFYNAFLEVC